MRLLKLSDNGELSLVERNGDSIPEYAILSHTWGPEGEEVTYEDLMTGAGKHKSGYDKIRFCGNRAKTHGLRYFWIDTCCIDKKSSAELSETINSMYSYYHEAAECLVFLADVWGSSDEESQWQAICRSRWIMRGWTLQEFIAPKKRVFLADDWTQIKGQERDGFLDMLAQATGIDSQLLRQRDRLPSYCVAERMSWASKRETTRSEDKAYSLMGLFNINMPVIYGEGAYKAFKRLQHEIMKIAFDHTIFAWRGNHQSSGLLAKSPSDFVDTPMLGLWDPKYLTPYAMTNVGLFVKVLLTERNEAAGGDQERLQWPSTHWSDSGESLAVAIQCDVKVDTQSSGVPLWHMVVIYLQSIPGAFARVDGSLHQAYRRVRCAEWSTAPGWHKPPFEELHVLILDDDQFMHAGLAAADGWNRWNTSYR